MLDDAVRFLTERVLADGPNLKPAYSVIGTPPPAERNLDLPGYPGAVVTIGNAGASQFQLDAHGEAVLLFAAAARHDRLDSVNWHAAQAAVTAIRQRWRQPDAGTG